ncbi:hypothetical protein ACOME3_002577 [Neoechinorhynchus agilis]
MTNPSKKREKKKKPIKQSYADFCANASIAEIVTVTNDWAEMASDNDDDQQVIQIDLSELPKQPRGPTVVPLEKIPTDPPFVAYLNGIPFAANENDIRKFFFGCNIKTINMQCADGRNRGNATVEFDDRESLIRGLEQDERVLINRTVHVSLEKYTQSRFQRPSGNNQQMSSMVPSSDAHTVQNWRSQMLKLPPPSQASEMPGRRQYHGAQSLISSRSGRDGHGSDSRYYQRERGDVLDSYRSGSSQPRPTLVRSETTPSMTSTNEQQIRKVVDTGKLAALLTSTEAAKSERSQSIFGEAKPVDTASRMEQLQKTFEDGASVSEQSPLTPQQRDRTGQTSWTLTKRGTGQMRNRMDRNNDQTTGPRFDRRTSATPKPSINYALRNGADSLPTRRQPTARRPGALPPNYRNQNKQQFVTTNRFANLKKYVSDEEKDDDNKSEDKQESNEQVNKES